jgi:hypothetical protein
MKSKKQSGIFVIFLFAVVFGSCSKDAEEVAASQCVTPANYTARDETGNFLGPVDTTDWRLDDYWTQCEQDFLELPAFTQPVALLTRAYTHPMVFPTQPKMRSGLAHMAFSLRWIVLLSWMSSL